MKTKSYRENQATETENELGTISPGLLGSCSECQSAFGMEPREFYHGVHVSQTIEDEGSFSWADCELCGSGLGGDRYHAHAVKPLQFIACATCGEDTTHDRESSFYGYVHRTGPTTHQFKPQIIRITHLDVCADCLFYTANGEPFPEED